MHRTLAVPPLRTLLALLAAALLASAAAQDARPLVDLAPADTVVAFGTDDAGWPEGDLAETLAGLVPEGAGAAWERLVDALVAEAPELAEVLPTGPAPDVDAFRAELDAQCPGLAGDLGAFETETPLAESLVAVAMDPFAPFPAGLALARVRDAAGADVTAAFERAVGCFAEDDAGEQDGTTLHVIGDASDLPLVVALHDDLLLVGTRPEVVRAAIRLEEGAEEPALGGTELGAALDALPQGVRFALNASALAAVLDTRVPALGDPVGDLALERGVAALRTLGGVAVGFAAEEAGLRFESVVPFDSEGGDAELAALLACEGCEAPEPTLVPADAVRASGTVWRAEAWFDYLDGWVRDLSEADGEPTDLRTLLREEAGVDVDRVLFDWIGEDVQWVRLAPITPHLRDLIVSPPSAVVVPVASAEAAEEGVRALAEAIAALAAEDDPDLDLEGLLSVREVEADGTAYRRVRFGPNGDYGIGLVDDHLVVATPAAAFEAFAATLAGGSAGVDGDGWARVEAQASGDLVAWSYGEGGADLRGLAEIVDVLAQPLAFVVTVALAEGFGDDEAADDFGFDFGGYDPVPTVDVATASSFERTDLAGVDAAPLAVGDAVEGRIGAETPRLGERSGDLYRLEGLAAGTTYTVELTSDAFDTYLYLYDLASGEVLGSNDDAPTTDRSAIRIVADADTELAVGATSWSGSAGGAYLLRVVEGALGSRGAGGVLDLSTALPYATSELGGAAPRALAAPGAVEGRLARGADAATLDGRLVHLYRLEDLAALAPDEEVTVELTSDAFDTYLHLLDAEGGLLAENDDAPHTGRSELRFRAGGADAALVAVGSWGGQDDGAYRLEVRAGDAPLPEAEAAEEVEAASFADLLLLADALTATLVEVADRLGPQTATTVVEDGALRTRWLQEFDW